jgi:methylthioribulose-1-phosphate dehydratase
MLIMMINERAFQVSAQNICEVGRFLYSKGWCPATSSNFSMRVDEYFAAITASGKHKGELSVQDILLIDMNGNAIQDNVKPSAETFLHTALYQRDPQIGCVLHTHSVNATVLSRLFEKQGFLEVEDYEVLKALPNIETHETKISIPIFPNTQDIAMLAKQVDDYLNKNQQDFGYCIAGHGFYTWGKDIETARRHIEAFEFLFECVVLELQLKCKLNAS